jgi:hypothetical protein
MGEMAFDERGLREMAFDERSLIRGGLLYISYIEKLSHNVQMICTRYNLLK